MNNGGIELDKEELANFAIDSEAQVDDMRKVAMSIASVHLHNSALGFFGSLLAADAQQTLDAIVKDTEAMTVTLGDDASIARSVVAGTIDADEIAMDSFGRTDLS